ncbi:hypothetical protein N478_03430 [Pseudoalteromonas luteoviolacea S4060-1]|uniref:Uncharacterized protein n=1 Tax=Pseudoalteromonas luteoviolacea S4060-1 TaxID=1365257 RepID=A0A167KUV9_9GAMM|nr:hypothetical protein N478_03430 [Pseudoalteromonas luteoviolacea S4060-1]
MMMPPVSLGVITGWSGKEMKDIDEAQIAKNNDIMSILLFVKGSSKQKPSHKSF